MASSLLKRLRGFLGTRHEAPSTVKATVGATTPPEPDPSPSAEDGQALLDADRLRDSGLLQEALEKILRLKSLDHLEVQRRLGIVFYMLGRLDDARLSFDAVLTAAPNDPLSLKFLCGCLNGLGRSSEALQVALRAIAASPRDAQLRNALGAMYVNVGEIDQAIDQFQIALEINPTDLTPLANLEVLRARFGAAGFHRKLTVHSIEVRAQTIADLTRKLSRSELTLIDADLLCTLTNNHSQTFHIAEEIERRCAEISELPLGLTINLAVVCQNRGDLDRALSYAQRATSIDANSTEARNALGALYISQGGDHWLDGWRRVCETYRLLNPRNYPAELPQWAGEPLGAGRLFVHFDQGVGDALLGLRFLQRLHEAGIKPVLWLPTSMSGLVAGLDSIADLVVSDSRPDARGLGCSFACGLLELVAPLQIPVEKIGIAPQITPASALTEKWRTRFASLSGRKIGLSTIGNPNRVDDWLRSVPGEALQALSGIDGISWVNLAVDQRPERETLIEQLDMLDVSPELVSFAETAAAISALDLVIAIDCSTAHLAASVGTPLWLLKPTMLDWRWQIGDVMSPWWPSARVFSSTAPGRWDQVGRELLTALRT